MLTIQIPAMEFFDESKNEFVSIKEQTVQLEHSLVSLSKWESKWHKPFLDDRTQKTQEETLDYIRCMTVSPNVKDEVYRMLTNENVNEIKEYIDNPMTATTFQNNAKNRPNKREIITSEIIYYWMIANEIPFDPCQKWHLNRLLTLIKVCSIKNNQNPKKMSKREIMSKNQALNAARRNARNSSG